MNETRRAAYTKAIDEAMAPAQLLDHQRTAVTDAVLAVADQEQVALVQDRAQAVADRDEALDQRDAALAKLAQLRLDQGRTLERTTLADAIAQRDAAIRDRDLARDEARRRRP